MHSNGYFNENRALIDLRQMRHVVTLARSGSYVAAAQTLGITQPALTRSIQSVEARYGVRLFDRGRAGVVPTDAGHDLIARATSVLHDAEMLDRSMLEQRAGISGEVRFGMGPLVASTALVRAVPAIMHDYPAIDLRIAVAGGAALLDQLTANAIQFAICSGRGLSTDPFAVRPLGLLSLCVVVRAAHPLAGRRVSVEETRTFAQIGGTVDDRTRNVAADYRPRVACDNYEILRALTLASDTLWITSPAVVTGELADGTMARVDCPDLITESYEVVMLTRKRGAMSRAAGLIAERMEAVLAPAFTASGDPAITPA